MQQAREEGMNGAESSQADSQRDVEGAHRQ